MEEHKTTNVKILDLSIESIQKISEDTIEFTINTKDHNFNFIPGQYVRITIPDLLPTTKGGNTRDFSITSSSGDTDHIVLATRVSGSAFKKRLLSLSPGSKIKVQGPLGWFTLPENEKTPLVLIAGGIGITPFLSMLRQADFVKGTRKIQLIYANATPARAVYLQEIENIARKLPGIKVIPIIGEITTEYIKKNVGIWENTLWYICGPSLFVKNLLQKLPSDLAIPSENIRIEEYVGYEQSELGYFVLDSTQEQIRQLTSEDMSARTFLQSLLQAIGLGAILSITDTAGNIVYINDKFIEVSKYPKQELIGQNHRILKSGHHSAQFYDELWKMISSGHVWRGEIKNRAKDGTFYWVDSTIVPVFGGQGVINYFLAIRFVITRKKELESQVEGQTKELQSHIISLETLNKAMVDRESRVVELKKEIEKLKKIKS